MDNEEIVLVRALRKERQLGVGPLWWSHNGEGYTDQYEDAGRFTLGQAQRHQETEGLGNLAIQTEEEAEAAYDGRTICLQISPAELQLLDEAIQEAIGEKSPLDILEGFADEEERAAKVADRNQALEALQRKINGGYVRR